MSTPNYGLHQWEKGDRPPRAEINQTVQTIDTALGQKADQTSLNSQISSVNSTITSMQSSMNTQVAAVNQAISDLQERIEVFIGNYIGNDSFPRTISLGFTPRAVLIERQDNLRTEGAAVYGGLFSAGKPLINMSRMHAEVVSGGFQLNACETYNMMNKSSNAYVYIVFW